MDQILECLITLQKSDMDRISHIQSRDEIKLRLLQLVNLLERGHRELSDKKDKLSSAELFYREKSLELKSEMERAKDAKSKLSNVTKQKEFLASQKEVEYLKRSNGKKEEEIVNLLQAIDEYKAGISENQGRIKKLEDECEEERTTNSAALTTLEKNIKKLESSRTKLTSVVKSSILKRYERILKARDGQAVVPILAGGVCSGCHMHVQAQTYQVLMKTQTHGNCPSCQRFIYVPAEDVFTVTDEVAEG